MKLSPDQVRHLTQLRDTTRPLPAPEAMARSLRAAGMVTINVQGLLRITGKGRDTLRQMQMQKDALPKKYV